MSTTHPTPSNTAPAMSNSATAPIVNSTESTVAVDQTTNVMATTTIASTQAMSNFATTVPIVNSTESTVTVDQTTNLLTNTTTASAQAMSNSATTAPIVDSTGSTVTVAQTTNLLTNIRSVTETQSPLGNISTTRDITASSHSTPVIYETEGTSSYSDVTSALPDTSTTWTKTDISTSASGFSGKTLPPTVKCAEPWAIAGGKLLTTGPYLANVSSAVYSCVAGFMLTGQAKIGCNGTGFWDAQPPKCVRVDNTPSVHNHISLDDSAKVPVWLTVILCVTFGLVCLLLLACLLMYCLKIFGCWKGATVGPKLVVRESEPESARRSGPSMVMVDDFESNGKHYRSKRVSYREGDSSFMPVRSHPYKTTPRMQDGSKGRMYRREAKMPANSTWMPHSRNMRKINTSTK